MTDKLMALDDALETIRTQARSERDKGTAFERLCRVALMTHPGEFGALRFERIIPWGECGADAPAELVTPDTQTLGDGNCAAYRDLAEVA